MMLLELATVDMWEVGSEESDIRGRMTVDKTNGDHAQDLFQHFVSDFPFLYQSLPAIMGLPLMAPEILAGCLLQDPIRPNVPHTIAAIEHRQRMIRMWQIAPGSKVLEIGCGQGDFTIALADALGPNGHVVAVDPAPLDDGTPSFRSAREYVLQSAVGSRIEFIKDDPASYLSRTEESFDYIVFCHCIWYFADPSLIFPMFTLARKHARTLLIAEYGMVASEQEAVPHVFAALAANVLESYRDETSLRNIRSALTPRQISTEAEQAGWKNVTGEYIVPGKNQRDGYREVRMALSKFFSDDIERLKSNGKTRSMLFGMRNAIDASVAKLRGGVEEVRNMDVWVSKFEH